MATKKILNDIDVDGDIVCDKVSIDGGTSNRFLKADGSVDANTYSTTDTQLTTEEVQDIIGFMVQGNTEQGISVTYTDGDGKLNFDAGIDTLDGTAAADQVAYFDSANTLAGDSNFTYDDATEKLTVGDRIEAQYYVNTPLMFTSNFSHTTTSSTAWVNIPFNSVSETTTRGEQHCIMMPYNGRVRKIMMRHTSTGGAPTATTNVMRVLKNNVVQYTSSSSIIAAGVGQYSSFELSDTAATFNTHDIITVQFKTNLRWFDTTFTCIIQLT
tara:strand:- start:616 stop:1425 length:810 start_codon:yes stop_codon:yes gene_type:complete